MPSGSVSHAGSAAGSDVAESRTSLPDKVCFGVFELDTRSGELRKQGLKVRLPHQSFQILAALLERPGSLVSREELRQKLWPGETFVDFDTGVSSAVKKLRQALGESAETPRFVETLPKHGYRFIAAVNETEQPAAEHPGAPPLAEHVVQSPVRRRRVASVATFVIAAAAAALALALGGWDGRLSNMVHRSPIRSVAVLPFENLTGDSAQDGLVAAVTDSLTTELVRTGLVEVASRTSAAQFGDSRVGLREIARRLNVDAVVEGTVSRRDDDWQLNVQLIRGSSDRHVWAQLYRREQEEIAASPRELAWEIVRAIPPELRPQNERGQPRRRPANERAYEAYVLGRHFMSRRGPDDVAKAIDYFEQAIERDPGYGPAHSGLSDAHRIATHLQEAETSARTALALDGSLAEAHVSLAALSWRKWNWEEAESGYRRALELDPTYAEGYRSYGMMLVMLLRYEDAVIALRRAHELDRLSPLISVEYANALTLAGRYDEALQELQGVRAVDPSNWKAYQGMAFVHAANSDWARAIAVLEEPPGHRPDRASYPWLGYYFAAAGRRADALRVLENFERRIEENETGDRSIDLAILHLGLGDRQKALDLLEVGFIERPADVTLTALLYPLLRDEPRYQAILSSMGLRFSDDA